MSFFPVAEFRKPFWINSIIPKYQTQRFFSSTQIRMPVVLLEAEEGGAIQVEDGPQCSILDRMLLSFLASICN